MLQLRNIFKTYVTGETSQDALKNVSVNFRDNEFVSITPPIYVDNLLDGKEECQLKDEFQVEAERQLEEMLS